MVVRAAELATVGDTVTWSIGRAGSQGGKRGMAKVGRTLTLRSLVMTATPQGKSITDLRDTPAIITLGKVRAWMRGTIARKSTLARSAGTLRMYVIVPHSLHGETAIWTRTSHP